LFSTSPRRMFRKVLEGSSIYSFQAWKMPSQGGVGCHRFPKKPNNQLFIVINQSRLFSFVKKP
jgi:hypothetical protein